MVFSKSVTDISFWMCRVFSRHPSSDFNFHSHTSQVTTLELSWVVLWLEFLTLWPFHKFFVVDLSPVFCHFLITFRVHCCQRAKVWKCFHLIQLSVLYLDTNWLTICYHDLCFVHVDQQSLFTTSPLNSIHEVLQFCFRTCQQNCICTSQICDPSSTNWNPAFKTSSASLMTISVRLINEY